MTSGSSRVNRKTMLDFSTTNMRYRSLVVRDSAPGCPFRMLPVREVAAILARLGYEGKLLDLLSPISMALDRKAGSAKEPAPRFRRHMGRLKEAAHDGS